MNTHFSIVDEAYALEYGDIGIYAGYAIMPTDADCTVHCRNANNEYQCLQVNPPKLDNESIILEWMERYKALYNYVFPISYSKHHEVLLFKANYEASYNYYCDLIDKNEYEVMPPCISVWIDTGAKNILHSDNYVTTAVAPTDHTKFDADSWRKGLEQESYHAFYIECDPSINIFELLGNEFTKPTEILVVASDNTIMVRVNNRIPLQVKAEMKGILFLRNDYYEHILPRLTQGIRLYFARMK